MNLCKKVFAELLLSRGYEIEAKSLGLVESEGKRRVLLSTRFSAWISTKDAMNIIGRSESWMKKKRQADRKKRTKTSIPFIGSGKGLLYPKSALQAYRIQDWNTLSELCDKYGIGTQDKNIAEEEKIETMRNRQMEFRKKPLF